MKVYVVTTGEYSDYHIDEIFTDETKAQQYVHLKNILAGGYYYNIEPYETDTVTITEKEQNKILDRLAIEYSFTTNGTVVTELEVMLDDTNPNIIERIDGSLFITVPKGNKTPEQCLKIARDTRAKYLSEKYGL